MNKKVIILGVIFLLIVIPKPYSFNYGSDCHAYPSGGKNVDWCIGIVYPVNQDIQKIPDHSLLDKDYCTETKHGWACAGISIFKSGHALN